MKRAFLWAVVLSLGFLGVHSGTTAPAEAPAAVQKDPAPPVVPTVTLPEKKTAKPNRYFCLKAGGNCTSVKWIIPTGLEKLDPEIPIKDSALAVVLIGDTGTYTVQAYGALGDQASDIASCVVTVGTPKPPTPPTPPDPLTAAFQTAYNLDADTDKAESLAFLVAAYDGMAKSAPTWTAVKTVADVLATEKAVVQAPTGLKLTQVQNLRKAIAADFTKRFGSTGTAPVDLATVATYLSSVATALKGVS